MSDVHRLQDDAPRYVVAALTAHGPQDLDALADNYVPPKPNDMAELKSDYRNETLDAGRIDNHDVKQWLIENAITEINAGNNSPDHDGVIILDEESGGYWLADGVNANQLQVGGEPLVRARALPDLFTPETGLWADNVRSFSTQGLKELRESMGQLGWLPELPGVKDENDVIIVGHRRDAVAKELGIEPVFKTVHFGEGVAADAAKAALAIASNVGAEKISPADRKKIAADLYGSGWSMAKIGELLKVATMTVSRDLSRINNVKPRPERGGRPRKKPELKPEPIDEDTVAAQPTTTEPPGGLTEDSPGQTDRVRQALEKAVAKPQEPAAEPEVIKAEVVESEPVNAEVVKPKPKPINDPKPEPAPESKPVEEPKSVPPGGLTEDSPGMIDAKAAGAVTEPTQAEEAPAEEVAAQEPGARTVDELVQVLVDATVALEALTEGWEAPDTPPMPVVPFIAGASAVVDSVRERLSDVGMALHNMDVSSVIDRAVKPRSRRGRPPKHKPPFDHKPPLTVAELGGPAFRTSPQSETGWQAPRGHGDAVQPIRHGAIWPAVKPPPVTS